MAEQAESANMATAKPARKWLLWLRVGGALSLALVLAIGIILYRHRADMWLDALQTQGDASATPSQVDRAATALLEVRRKTAWTEKTMLLGAPILFGVFAICIAIFVLMQTRVLGGSQAEIIPPEPDRKIPATGSATFKATLLTGAAVSAAVLLAMVVTVWYYHRAEIHSAAAFAAIKQSTEERAGRVLVCQRGSYLLPSTPIGKGGFGQVFSGTDKETGQAVAIKMPLIEPKVADKAKLEEFVRRAKLRKLMEQSKSPDKLSNDQRKALEQQVEQDVLTDEELEQGKESFRKHLMTEAKAALAREAHNLEQLGSHPNIVKYLDYCQADGALVTEFVGARLGHKLDEPTVRAVMRQLADALCFLHTDRHQMHLDVKPDNMLLTEDGIIKLIDFGMMRDIAASPTGRHGTSLFMAPEMLLLGQKDKTETKEDGPDVETPKPAKPIVTEKADIWSMGIAAIVLAGCAPYGKLPYGKAEKTNYLADQAGQQRLQPDTQCLAGWSAEGHRFVEGCLQMDAGKRDSADQLLKSPWFSHGLDDKKLLIK